MSTDRRAETPILGHYEFAWLLRTRGKIAPNIRSELLKTIHEPIAIACTLHIFTFSVACFTYFTISSNWSLLWACSEVIAASTRVPLLWRLKSSSSIESTLIIWLHRITTLWFFFLGLAALGGVLSGNVTVAIITTNLIIALQGGIASRLASTPRFAVFLSTVLIAPTILGVWGADEAWAYAIPISYILCFFGMQQLTKQNYKILCDKITAEHQNLALLMRDSLTGLANRRELRNKIQTLNTPPLRTYALLCLDLDGFKAVNDQYGHLVGDKLLVAVGQRLTSQTRSDDLICRVGGDEFVVVLVDIDEEGAKRRATEMIASLSEPFELSDGIQTRIGVSIGIALSNSRTTPLESIVKQADDALYQAKRAGKGTYKLSDS
ncbi:GGDEF domain-containing protein [Ectopseudomonas hydrolytica]|uniref:GGDEF domain-containing protein n=1 Tax=Ectopseudomonas hydrolytica TaxID=2493633 RepID=UPI003EE105C3